MDFSTLCQGKIVPEQNNVTAEEGKKLDIFGIKPSQAREGKINYFLNCNFHEKNLFGFFFC